MSVIRRHPVVTLIALGTGIRVALAFTFFGHDYDIGVFRLVEAAYRSAPLDVYELNPEPTEGGVFAWPYPPLYLEGLGFAAGLAGVTGAPFHATIHALPIAADAGIALAVHTYLGWRGAEQRIRLAGAALVMLGPVFIAVSGYHAQFDQVAILPAVLAMLAWERGSARVRPVGAGLLTGIGAALKTVPLLVALPLLACSRTWREGATLIAAAVAVPIAVTTPFLVADPAGILELRHYRGLPGLGGLSLVSDPASGSDWMTLTFDGDRSPIGELVVELGGAMTAVGLAGLAAFLFRYRPDPVDGAVLLWLTIYVLSPNFFIQYLIWGLPFFIMAGYVREVAILQVALIPAVAIFYAIPFADPLPAAAVYVPMMICLWVLWALALGTLAVRHASERRAHPRGVQPPLVHLGARAGVARTYP